jgi:uncharacterized protein (TIGR02391 family)
MPVYEHFHRESSWPVLRRLQHALFQSGDRAALKHLVEAIPRHLLSHDPVSGELRLSARGIRAIAGPDAQELLDLVALIQLAVSRYREDSEGTLTSSDAATLGLPSARLSRAHLIARDEPYLWRGGQWDDSTWEMRLSDDIWEFDGVSTVDAYFATTQRLRERHAAGVQGMSIPGPSTAALRFAGMRDAELGVLGQLHPDILRAAGSLFNDRYFALAIFEAFKAIEGRVRERTGIDRTGVDLMAHVFKEQDPLIDLAVEPGRSGDDERKGFRFIFMGVMAGVRNPKAHGHVEQSDPQRTMEYLALASLLMRRLDDATEARDGDD